MSTETAEATVQTAALGTPGSGEVPVTATTKSMVADAFKQVADTPAKTEPPATTTAPAKAEPKVDAKASPAKTETAPSKVAVADNPEDKLEIPANASPEAVKNFKSYKESMKGILAKERTERAAAEKAAADLQAQIATRTAAAPADTAQMDQLKAEHKAALDRLAILDLQNHPDFTRQYVEPQKKALAVVAEVLGYNEKPVPELGALLGKSMKEFNATVSELTKDMNTADAATVAMSLREARTLHAAEQSALAKSGELSSQLKAKTAQQQKQAFEGVVAEVLPAFKKVEVSDTMSAEEKQAAGVYNQSIDGLRQRAEARVFGNITERDVATMAFKELAYETMSQHLVPAMQKAIDGRNAVIADLTAQLEAVKGSRSPGSGAGDIKTGDGNKHTTDQLVAAAYHGQR